jgi:HEPN domain-containing protein
MKLKGKVKLFMKKATSEWLRFSEIDLNTAGELINNENLTPSIAFHSQQCIEKAFKAVLCEKNIEIPRIHNLLKLFDMVKQNIHISINIKDLEYINETYIDSRYPSEFGLLPEGIPSLRKVKNFYLAAKTIYIQIKEIL